MMARQIVQAIRVVAALGPLVCVSGVHAGGACELHEIAQLTASDPAGVEDFGYSVAISGDTAIVGADQVDGPAGPDQGSAFVYVRAGGVWTEQARVSASDAAAGDLFGLSVAVDGDTAIVGAHEHHGPAGKAQGSAYVFIRTGSKWTEQVKLTASDAAAGDNFGYSVALSGNSAIVGALHAGLAGTQSGSAYVFIRMGSMWTEQAKLTASDAAANDLFGYSVTIAGDTATVGAREAAGIPGGSDGAAYIFVRSGSTWTQQAKLTASDGAAEDQFGHSVAVTDDTAIIGAPVDDASVGPAGVDQGSAYVFVRSGSTWTQQAKLTASDGAAHDNFGYCVAVAGSTAIVGALHHSGLIPEGALQGSAYVYVRNAGVWMQQGKLTASDADAFDTFGNSVALSGDTAIVGSRDDDGPTGFHQGSAYVFDVHPLPFLPSIRQHPQAQVVLTAHPALFSVVAAGTGPFTYQWREDGAPMLDGGAISGATTPTLTINPAEPDDAGSYDVVVSNDCGPVVSDPATLTVTPLAPADLNQDGVVNTLDLGILLAFWGPVGLFPLADINGDGTINTLDLGILLAGWTL